MEENTIAFTISFTGKRAQEIAERFSAFFWDGGLDQTIEQEFLEEYGLDCEDMTADAPDHCIINTDGH